MRNGLTKCDLCPGHLYSVHFMIMLDGRVGRMCYPCFKKMMAKKDTVKLPEQNKGPSPWPLT